jgi:hypothetical protein
VARARNIKPGFFKNEILGVQDPFVSLLFAGLWTLADKSGRLEDRPLRIKGELFPYRDGFDVNAHLTVLHLLGFIHRYQAGELALIEIVNFEKHQNPHHTEKRSEYPAYSECCVVTGITPLNTRYTPADSLIPSTLIPDSLPTATAKTAAPKKQDTDLKAACKKTWQSYAAAFFNRYGTEPVRNATVNSQVKSFVQRIGAEEAHQVAGWFVMHQENFYVRKGHTFGPLLADAEKLRTEWATGRRMNVQNQTKHDAHMDVMTQLFGGSNGNDSSDQRFEAAREIESGGENFPEIVSCFRQPILRQMEGIEIVGCSSRMDGTDE